MNFLKRLVGGSKKLSLPNQTQEAPDEADEFKTAGQQYLTWSERNNIRSASEAWAKLKRPDWMLWLVDNNKVELDESKLSLFACDCAEAVLLFFEEKYPEDKRPRQAVDTARCFANGDAAKETLVTAWTAALTSVEAAKSVVDTAEEAMEAAKANDRSAEAALQDATRTCEEYLFGNQGNVSTVLAMVKTREAAVAAAFATYMASIDTWVAASATYLAVTAAWCTCGGGGSSAWGAAKAAAEAAGAKGVVTALAATESVGTKGAATAADPSGEKARDAATSAARVWQSDRLRFHFPAPFSAKQ